MTGPDAEVKVHIEKLSIANVWSGKKLVVQERFAQKLLDSLPVNSGPWSNLSYHLSLYRAAAAIMDEGVSKLHSVSLHEKLQMLIDSQQRFSPSIQRPLMERRLGEAAPASK